MGTPGQGPFLAVVLKLDGDVIAEAQFQTYGCAIACGRYPTERLESKTLTEAAEIGAGDVASGVNDH